MSLSLLRTRLQRWLSRPAGALAVAALLCGLVLPGAQRVEMHAHALGDHPHAHEQAHDHDADHDDHDSPHGEAVLHVHATFVPAAALPAVASFAPAAPLPIALSIAPPLSIALPNRPTELFRPPIA